MAKKNNIPKLAFSKRIKNALSKPLIYLTGLVAGISSTMVCTSCSKEVIDDPYADAVYQFYEDVGAHTSYASQKKDSVFRAEKIDDGIIKINVQLNAFSEEERTTLQNVVDEVNDVFENINPDYNLQINEKPTKEDLTHSQYIDLVELTKEDAKSSGALEGGLQAKWSREKGKRTWTVNDAILMIKRDKFTDNILTHELLHYFGLGDAYQSANVYGIQSPVRTIMSAHGQNNYIRENDIALLAGLYGDYSTGEKKDALVDYIENYEENKKWYQALQDQAQECLEKAKLLASQKLSVSEEELDFNVTGSYWHGVEAKDTGKYISWINNARTFEDELLVSHSFIYSLGYDLNSARKGLPSTDYHYLESLDDISFYKQYDAMIFQFIFEDELYQASIDTNFDFISGSVRKTKYRHCSKNVYDEVLNLETVGETERSKWFKKYIETHPDLLNSSNTSKKIITVPEEELE